MYYDYFGLKQPPFRITPDTSLFYPGGDRGAVLEALIYAIVNGEGMVKVVGEVGSGKTMLCRMLEQELPDKVEVVYLANPSLSPENILQAIAFELKLAVQPDTSRLQVMHNLQNYLLERHAENRQVVVFVEEAQAMPIATLEEIRLLSNLETQQSKLLQIVLFGQPELDELLAKPEIRQLKERITYSFQLNPFVSEHIRDYVNTRLRAIGYRSSDIFNKAAIRKIAHYSRGLVRRINILADKSLLAAYAGNTNQVTAKHVEQAARDSEFVTSHRRVLWATLVTASILLVFVAIMGFWQTAPGGGSTAFNEVNQLPLKMSESTDGGNDNLGVEESSQVEKRMLVSADKQDSFKLESDRNGASVVENSPATTVSYEIPKSQLQLSLDESIVQKSAPESTTLSSGDLETEEREQRAIAEPGRKIVNSTLEDGVERQILDLSTLFEIQDLSDARLSNQESERLRKQLKALPPEVALYQDAAQFSDICKLCWSILYRPVTEAENL